MDFTNFKNKFEKVPIVENNNNVFKKPLVSVCVQTYQHVDFISECLDGILMQQTDFPFEILLGEDESTDDTKIFCEYYANKFPEKIRLFYHKRENNIIINGKPSGRFNMLYNLFSSKAKYIALCEGDDYWTDPLKLQKQVDFLENNLEYNMCFHEAEIVNEKNELISLFNKSKDIATYNLIDFTKMNFVSTASSLFRNNIILKESFKQLSAGDWALHMINAEIGKIYYMPECMSAYRIHDGGVWSSLNHNEMILKGVEVMKELDVFFDYKYHDEFQDGIENRILRLIKEKESPTLKNKILKKIKFLLKNKINN